MGSLSIVMGYRIPAEPNRIDLRHSLHSDRSRPVLNTSKSPICLALALIIQVSHTPGHVTPVQPEYWEKIQRSPAG